MIAKLFSIVPSASLPLLTLTLGLLFSVAASAEPIEPVDPAPDRAADFYVDVYPILEGKCLACHSRARHEASLVLEDVAGILKGGDTGPAVVAGQPDQSLLFKLCARVDEPAMPPLPNRVGATALTPQELGRLRRWIVEGAKPGKLNPSAAAIGWQALPSTMMSSFAMALGPQDRLAAVGRANVIAVYDLVSGREVAKLGDPLIRSVKTPSLLPLYDRDVAHFDVVSSLAFSPDGNLLASGGYREIKIWQRQRNALSARIEASGPVRVAAAAPSGGRLLTARADGTIAVWDMEDQAEVSAWGPLEDVTQVTLLHDGRRAVVVRKQTELSLWDVAEKKELRAWSTDQPVTSLAASTTEDAVFTGHADGSLRRWNLPAELPEKIEAPASSTAVAGASVALIRISPDGKQLIIGLSNGKVQTAPADLTSTKETLAAPEGSTLLALAADNVLAVTAPESKKSVDLRRAGKTPEIVLSAVPLLSNRARDLADDFAVSQTRKALAEEAAQVANKESDDRAAGLEMAKKSQATATEAMTKAQAAADESEAALKKAQEDAAAKPEDEALKKAVTDAEAAAKKAKEALTAPRDALTAADRNVRFAESGAQTARAELAKRRTVVEERTTAVAELEKELAAAKASIESSTVQILSAAVSSDSKFIATGHSDGLVHLWAAGDGRWLDSFEGHSAGVPWLAFAGTEVLVSIDAGGAAMARSIVPQWKLVAVLGTKPESRLDVSESPITDRVLALAFSRDGRHLASGGGEPSRGGEVIIWDVGPMTMQRQLRELHSDTVNTLAFSRDGRTLATGAADKFVRLTDIETGRLLKTLEGHTAHVLGVAWSPDGATLSSAGADGALKIWNTETGEQRKSVAATTGQVTAVAPVAVADQIVIANNKGQCQLVERSSGKVLRTYAGAAGYIYQIAATSDGLELMAAGEEGILRLWNLAKGELLRELKP